MNEARLPCATSPMKTKSHFAFLAGDTKTQDVKVIKVKAYDIEAAWRYATTEALRAGYDNDDSRMVFLGFVA